MTKLLAVFILSLFSKTCYGQYVQVSTNLLDLAISAPNLAIELPLNQRIAVELSGAALLPAERSMWSSRETSGARARVIGKYYPTTTPGLFEDFYLGTYLQRDTRRYANDLLPSHIDRMIVGVSMGFSGAELSGFYWSMGGGLGGDLMDESTGVKEAHIYLQASVGWRIRRADNKATKAQEMIRITERQIARYEQLQAIYPNGIDNLSNPNLSEVQLRRLERKLRYRAEH